jgi:hypothetical protein
MLDRARLVLVVVALFVALPAAAWAYVDPSAGSIFLQLLLGGVAGLLVAFKLMYHRILGWLGRRPPELSMGSGDAELPTGGGDAEPPR